MNLVLFLGAGFSAPFGHPVMNEFLGIAEGSDRLTDADRAFLHKLILEARRANSFIETSPTNLEDILSFYVMGERLRLENGDADETGHKLRTIIRKVYTEAPMAKDYWARYQPLQRVIGHKPSEFPGSLSIVTTNYDLNIESAFFSLGSSVDPGFSLNRIDAKFQKTGKLYSERGIPLFKLHGSVNWYGDETNETGIVVDDWVVKVHGSFDDEQKNCLPSLCTANYETDRDPIIVPPSFLKPDLPPALVSLWKGAAKALSQASMVAFIGYSFPASDTEMMYFLARALADNPNLRAVYLLDTNADAIASRLKGEGTRMGSHFRALLRPLNGNWVNSVLPI